MSWFRLDDQGAFHAKVLAAGNEAYGAWCRAGQWSSDHLTDGRVPTEIAHVIAPRRVWLRMIAAIPAGYEYGLAVEIPNGYEIHDYLAYNPSAETVRAERNERSEAKREAGRRGGLAKAAKQAASKPPSSDLAGARGSASGLLGTGGLANAKQNVAPSRPVPSRPQEHMRPAPPDGGAVGGNSGDSSKAGTGRGARLSPDWRPSPALIARFRARKIDALGSFERFQSWALSASGKNATKTDWDQAFNGWVLRDIADGKATPLADLDDLPILRLPNRAALLAHDLAHAPDMTGVSFGSTHE